MSTILNRDRRRIGPGRSDKIKTLGKPKQDGGGTPALGVAAEAAAARNTQYRWLILAGLILAAAMEVLDTTIINVALPQMAGNLSTTTQEIAWVSTGYILSNVIVLPMTAFLNSLFGRRNYLVGSIILFTISSFFCGTSHSLGELVVWRILQGAGGAALISTAQATLVQVFSPKEQAIVQPIFLMGIVVFPTLGPALGGYITDTLTWNWCFFINIPIGIIAGGLVFFLLHDTIPAKSDEPIDWAGIGLMAAALGSLQYVLEEGEQDDWFSNAWILRLTILSAISFIALVAWELSPRNTHPVIDLHVLKNSSLSAGIVLFIAVGFGLYGVNYLYPLLAQQQESLSPLQSGLSLVPGGIATAISIVFCGVITSNPKVSPDARLLTLFGIVLSVSGMWGLSHLNSVSARPDTFWPLILRGCSIGFLFVPINTAAIVSLKPDEVNAGVSLLGLGRQLGGSIGTAILATALDSYEHIHRASMVGYLTTANPAYNERLTDMTGTLLGYGYSHAEAQSNAIGLISQTLTTQVAALSYNDTFEVLMLISVAMVPAILLLKKAKSGTSTSAAMH